MDGWIERQWEVQTKSTLLRCRWEDLGTHIINTIEWKLTQPDPLDMSGWLVGLLVFMEEKELLQHGAFRVVSRSVRHVLSSYYGSVRFSHPDGNEGDDGDDDHHHNDDEQLRKKVQFCWIFLSRSTGDNPQVTSLTTWSLLRGNTWTFNASLTYAVKSYFQLELLWTGEVFLSKCEKTLSVSQTVENWKLMSGRMRKSNFSVCLRGSNSILNCWSWFRAAINEEGNVTKFSW